MYRLDTKYAFKRKILKFSIGFVCSIALLYILFLINNASASTDFGGYSFWSWEVGTIFIGLFFHIIGGASLLSAWGRKDDDAILMRTRYGLIFPAPAKFVRYEGMILILAGLSFFIASLLLRLKVL